MKKIIASCLICAFLVNQSLISALAADISVGGPLPTDTSVLTNGNITNIQTNTTVGSGQIGINSFNRFNVNQGDIVNLNLVNGQNKLVNLIFDNSASQINGVVNSYLNGQIGGNVLFANPNGFVIGEHGVFNVGSLTLMTPTEDSMKSLINTSVFSDVKTWNESNIESLIGFTFNDNNYLVNGNAENPIELAAGKIDISGKINSGAGIDLISGSEINLYSGSELNANMKFSEVNGIVTATPNTITQSFSTANYPKNLAMQDGKNIVIVASNTGTTDDVLSAIVNLKGDINANGADVDVKTEVHKPSGTHEAISRVTFNSSSKTNASNINATAVTKLDEMGNVSVSESFIPGVDQVIDLVTSKVTPITEVIIEKDAILSAINDVNLMAITDMTLSSSTIAPILALNYTQIDSKTQAIVKSEANISAKNLEVDALTNLNLNTSTKVTAMLNQGFNAAWEKVFGGSADIGNVGISTTINTIVNKAIIENGVNLEGVSDNISIIATTLSYHTDAAQNGLIPLVDKNRSSLGAIVDIIVTNIDNEAIMLADADITGDLNVQSYYKGNIISYSNAYSGGGNDTMGWKAQKLLRRVKLVDWLIDSTNITDSGVAGAISVAVSNINSNAKIGHVNQGNGDTLSSIKPKIKAGSINLKADLIDDKSSISAISLSEGTESGKGGALAFNLKNLDSKASAYGDFTLSNNVASLIYFTTANNIVTDNIEGGAYYRLKNSHDVITKAEYDKLPEREQKLYEALSKDVEIYKYNFFEGDIAYTTDAAYKTNFSTASGEFYSDSLGNIITKTEYDKLTNKSGYTKLDKVYYAEHKPSALSIKSNTEVLHSLVWYDYVKDFINDCKTYFKNDGKQSAAEVQSKWEGLDDNNVSNYLTTAGVSEETSIMDLLTSDVMMKVAANVDNFGLQYLFNTYAQSASDARSENNSTTSSYTGAIAAQVFNTTSNAVLEDNSSVVSNIIDKNLANITIEAKSNNELWTMATLLNPLTLILDQIWAIGSKNGSGYGAAVTISYSDSQTNAKIGNNVNIVKAAEISDSQIGNILVSSFSDGNYVTASHGSATADATGGSGSISMNIVNGNTEAGIGTSSEETKIQANNVTVKAVKDANYVNPILAITLGDKAYGAALSGIVLLDSVNSFINGTIEAEENVIVKAIYDKLAVNAILNLGLAKDKDSNDTTPDDSTNTPSEPEEPSPDLNAETITTASKWAKFKNWCANFFLNPELPEDIQERTANIENINIDAAQPSVDDSAAMAGIISFTGIANDVKATISDGANVNARNVSVEAKSDDNVYDIGLVLSAKGKTGVGATILADVFNNDVSAVVENASINATNNIIVDAKEDLTIVQASSGIASAKDVAGAGNISSIVQVNKITSAIKNSNINQDADNVSTTQIINLNAENKSKEVKTVGAVSIQNSSETSSEKAKAVGATLDGDVVKNDIKAFIDNSRVKASKELNVKAVNVSDFIVIDVAGAAALQGKAIAGTIAAYVAVNTIETYINNSTINAGTITLDASSDFYELVVNGVVAGGNKTGIGGSIRGDVIYNTINSYIDASTITATSDVTVINKEDVEQIAISVAGAGSSKEGAYSGVISVLANVSNQNNYINNSTVTANSLNLDTDRTMFNVAVTGAIAASLGPENTSIGASSYAVGIGHYVNTYIKNSNITTVKDIILTSNFDEDLYSIVFGGAGGNGISGSGAINTIVNSSNIYTFILDDNNSSDNNTSNDDNSSSDDNSSNDNNSASDDNSSSDGNNSSDETVKAGGQITVKSESDIDFLATTGNVAISTSKSSAGAAINTYVNDADISAGIEGVTVESQKGVDVLAKSTQKQKTVAVGLAGGGETSAEGSISTIVVSQDMDAYIKKSVVKTGKNVSVKTEDSFESKDVVGAVGISTENLAFGASVLTAVLGGENKAFIEDTTFDNYDASNSLENLIVQSTQNDIFKCGTIAGSAGNQAGVGGAVDTIVFNKTISAYLDNTDNIENSKFKNIDVLSIANTDLTVLAGAIGASAEVGAGATISTVVITKHINSLIQEGSSLTSDSIKLNTSANDNITIAAVAGSGAGEIAGSGVVNTTVVNSEMKSGIDKSTISAQNININTNAIANYDDISGAVAGAGVVGVGVTVTTNVIGYDITSFINQSVVKDFNILDVTASANSTYDIYAISGAGGKNAGGAGVVETNVVNNTITAYVLGDITGDKLTVKALDTVNFNGMAGSLAGGATAGVGATISTNSVTSTILAYIGSTDTKSITVDDIMVNSQGIQNFNNLLAMGFGGGQVGVGGSSLANIVDATVKSYIKENSSIESASNLKIEANDSTSITGSVVAGAGAQYVAGGASVGVNKITNTVEAYTENNVNLKLSKSEINATSITNLGTKDNKLYIAAGTAAAGGAATGAVLVNTVENNVNAYIGKKNNIISTGDLTLKAQADTNIYESVGGVAIGGVAGVGASVGVNNIDNTVNTLIGVDSVLNMPSGNLTLEAHSNEIIDATASIVGGGSVALSGGIIHNTIGKVVDNAQENALTGDDATVYETAKTQAENVLIASANELNNADKNYKEYSGTNTESTFSLFTKSENSGSSLGSTARLNTTSAFVDSGAKLNTKDTSLYAKNTNDVDIKVSGNTYGAAVVGVSAGVSNVYTTTNAFISNNVVIDSTGGINISSESVDNQDINVKSASGGIISGSGGLAKINSNKTANTYILSSSILEATSDLLLNALSKGIISSTVDGDSHGGVAVGVSVADAIIKGNTRIDIDDNVDLLSKEGNLTIKTNADEKSTAIADALSGSLLGGVGAEANAQTGKNNTVNIGKNTNILAKLAAKITSVAKNTSIAETDGRAYGVVSAGGTMTNSIIRNTSGVNIADANTNKLISAKLVDISSSVENNVDAQTRAGAGAAVGVSGSGVYTNISSTNDVVVGKNYSINTTDGAYSILANTSNIYKSYNDSSAYGAVGVTAGIIANTVNSAVSAISNADINANGAIEIFATNTVKKDSVSNYDLYGGAGGVVGVGAANLTDNIIMSTIATLDGNKAYALGVFDNGYINVSSQSILNVNEKVDVTAGGAVPVADGNVQVISDVKTKTYIKNKDIKTKDDDIYFLADNDIDIYTKSNVSSYGGIAIADGSSIAENNKAISSVIISSGVNSISGRDTYIQSVCDKNIQAYMYATTHGLIGAVGNSKAVAYNNSISEIIVENNAILKAYDSMNLTALDTTSDLSAARTAKGTTYIVFGIPITIYGEGNETETNNSNALITLNGQLESGLGANRNLVINKDGSYSSNGVNVIGKEQVGEITASDVQSDIDAYELTKNNKLAEIDDYISIENEIIRNAQNSSTEAQTQKAAYESKNQEYTNAINIANNIIENNNTIKETQAEVNVLNSVNEAWENAYSKSNNIVTIDESFGLVLQEYADNNSIDNIQSAWELYSANKSSTNLLALQNSISDMLDLKSTKEDSINNLNSINTTLATTVNAINTQVNCSNNVELVSFITEINEEIVKNNNSISICNDAINASNANVLAARNEIAKADAEKEKITEYYNSIIQELDNQKELAENSSIPVYSLLIDNIIVRSGDTTLTGKVEGNGTITAPGNKFTVDIVNNSSSDIVYKDIQIGRNISGLIHGSNIASTITKNILNSTNEYSISILNTVDANDPTIDLNVKNGFGDMVFNGNIENVNGLVKFINYTGNILSEGSITAKDLKISVPNGSYAQTYSDNTVTVGGSSGNGAIVASGDIDIASKIIDINGLIQSGSEIKSVTIPDFKVIKENGVYYQVIGDSKVAMQKGASDGYYYLNLSGNGQLDSDLEMIKAYFKPSDETNVNNILGDIHLFKAEIQGGNITLTGNIISTSNKGKIVLVNGYGHIDVQNNSNFNLVTSALNADANIAGKLTINDIKFSESDKGGKAFDSLKQEDIENATWLSENTGTYTANVDSQGNIVTSTKGITEGNGTWGSASSITRADGANIDIITYTPGTDAYYVTKAGSTETKSYTEYVKRSWWTELWHGKLYRTVYYTVTHKPEYGVAQNSVNVQFQGFSTPQINVNSNGSIIMNNSISALAGNIGLSSSNGSITTNSINNIISAQNINMSANNDIGSELKPIQTAIYNEGMLNVKAANVYINYPNSEISNIIVDATGNAYLATSGLQFGGLDGEVSINADSLELRADNGSIQLDSTKNDKINIEVNKLKARANGDIALINKGNLNISSIVSTSKGNIALGSKTGSIIATDNETLNPYHINGGNVVIKALNGYVGTSDNVLKVARDGIYNVISNGDINIYSAGRIHADSIQSLNGKVNLDADYGIIAATSSESLIYNIYSATGVDLNTKHGNIENIAINTDGVINAIAGYTDGIASGMSDISISLISKKEISQEYLATLTSDSEREAALNAYTAGLKDMKLGNVKASRNVIVNSEKSILNANNSSSLTGSQIVLSAVNGDVGTVASALKIDALKDVTVFAGNGKNVYLTTDNNLNINEIRSVNTYDSTTEFVNTNSVLGEVVLFAKGNIINSANDDRVNIKANNIVLTSNKDIGTSIKYLNVNTVSNDINKGLSVKAINAYINGQGSDLNIISSEISNNLLLNTEGNTSLAIQDVRVGNQLTAKSASDVNITGTIVANKSLIQAQNTTDINNANIEGIFNNESEALVVNNAELNTLTTSSTTANIANMVVSGDANITTTDKTTIANATVDGNLVNNSKDTEVTNKLTVGGNTSISAIDSIAINDASIYGYLNTIANTLKIDEIMLVGNINANVDNANIYTSEDLNIGNISGNKNAYTTALDIRSEKSIYNGLDTDDYNLYAKDITLKANETIGTLDNPLNIMLTNGNKLSMVSDNLISLSTNGTGANYSNIETKAFAIYTDDDINIKNINVEQAKITTSSNNLSIDNLIVEKSATLTTGNKRVIIDNTSLKPIINADVQLYLTQLPASIKINGDNNIITEAVNVTRHNSNILVNSDNNNNSMNSAINSSSATSIKNTNVSEKTIEKTEALLYKIPTQGTYKTNIEKSYGEGIIKNHVDEYVSPSNIFDVINNSKSKTSKIKYFHKISYDNIKYKKVSSL